MLARKAVVSHGIRQSPSRRMDIPANREDPPVTVHGVSVNKSGVVEPRRSSAMHGRFRRIYVISDGAWRQ